ncbi:MAG: 2-C-methyl-D-erythritol 2,4-cyclodiphosphate synthase [Cytophagales bacterium]|nr:MAG: 2-C-methyl-D-erythritol 2,4-cyclodiphosphate synthase [Cytophagales bacterium]
MSIRIGFGYDVHRLKEGRPFWLGGIIVPHTHGGDGHSDADVLVHVICDALLGAANMRNIGYHFSDKDAKYKNIDSKELLHKVMDMIEGKGYSINNIDTTVCLQEPKLNPYIELMKATLAPILKISEEDVSIKATTSELMGFVGRKEGIAAYAVVLIQK